MGTLEKKLLEIQELIKAVGAMLPSPKPPGIPKPPTTAPVSKKNPVKVAQQIQDQPTKKLAVSSAKEMIKTDSNGQWKIENQ